MKNRQPKSPREIVGVVEAPPKLSKRLTNNQAERIAKKLASPDRAIISMVKGEKKTEKLSLLVASKLGEPLKKAGVTEFKIAKVFNDALSACKTTTLGKDENGIPITQEIPDHRMRLAAAGMLIKLCGYEEPSTQKHQVEHIHQHTGIIAQINGKELRELEEMEQTLTIIAVESESDPGIERMVIENGNGALP